MRYASFTNKAALGLLPLLAACYTVTPEPEWEGFSPPHATLRHAGAKIATSDVQTYTAARRKGYRCPAGNRLPANRAVVRGGFPTPFDLQIENEARFTTAEVSIAGGTLTHLTPGAVRSTSVRDGQTVEIARLPLTGTDHGQSHLRFSVIPVTGTSLGGPDTVQVYARVLDDKGNAIAVPPVTAGSLSRLCGPT